MGRLAGRGRDRWCCSMHMKGVNPMPDTHHEHQSQQKEAHLLHLDTCLYCQALIAAVL